MKWIMMIAGMLVIQGCASSFPTILEEKIQPGLSRMKVEEQFVKQQNKSGEWQSKLIKQALGENGIEMTYVYKWVKSSSGYTITKEVPIYELTFINDQLISITEIGTIKPNPWWRNIGVGMNVGTPSPQNKGMSFQCKDAIARGDQGGIFTFCN